MMERLSRRAALAGGLALAAPVTAAALPAIGSEASPDAELIALGKELDVVYGQILKLGRESQATTAKNLAAFRAEYCDGLKATLGEDNEFVKACASADVSDGEFRDAMLRMFAKGGRQDLMFAFEKRIGFMTDGPDPVHDLIGSADPIARRMFALPAHTLEGVAAKARAAAYEHVELWEEEFDDLDWKDKFIRSLIESTLAAAGQTVPAVLLDETGGPETH